MRGNAGAPSAGIVAAGVAAALGLTTAPAAGTAWGDARVAVIVFLKDEGAGPGVSRGRSEQKSALIQAAQAPVVQQARQLGATNVKRYRLADAFAASVPAVVKQIMLSTATDLGAPPTEQGSGLLDSLAAVQEASSDPAAAASSCPAASWSLCPTRTELNDLDMIPG